MSLSTPGVWAVGVWAQTVWADGVWYETGGAPSPSPSPIPPFPGQPAAGSSRRKHRYYVEIDGQEFLLDSAEEARQLLEQARAIAERQAEEKGQKATSRLRRKAEVPEVRISVPAIEVSDELKTVAAPIIADIKRLYRNAAVEAELRLHLMKQKRTEADRLRKELEDDDEDLMLLL